MKEHKHIRKKGLTRLFKNVVENGETIKYFRQYFNGEPIHDWVKYVTDENGDQIITIDILKIMGIEDEPDPKIIHFNNETPPF